MNKSVVSDANMILMLQTCRQRSSMVVESKRQTLAFLFFHMNLVYVSCIRWKCRQELNLVLCTTSWFAKTVRLRSADAARIGIVYMNQWNPALESVDWYEVIWQIGLSFRHAWTFSALMRSLVSVHSSAQTATPFTDGDRFHSTCPASPMYTTNISLMWFWSGLWWLAYNSSVKNETCLAIEWDTVFWITSHV